MPRPDILDRCYASFKKNLLGIDFADCTCYINVDPLPWENERQKQIINRMRKDTVKVAEKYFKVVVSRVPKSPNYASAYKWLWGHAESELILNIEDDWELVKPINIKHLIKKFDKTTTLYQVVFRAYSYVYPTCCTSPSLLHRRWYRPISEGMNISQNPESQIHKNNDHRFDVFVPNKRNCSNKRVNGERREIEKYVIPYPKPLSVRDNIIVKDIGKGWIESSPYISPVDLIKQEKDMYRKHRKKMDRYQRKYAEAYIESLKKVNFLCWVIKPGVNPMKWLLEKQCN